MTGHVTGRAASTPAFAHTPDLAERRGLRALRTRCFGAWRDHAGRLGALRRFLCRPAGGRLALREMGRRALGAWRGVVNLNP